jgi:hypothetical protein
MVNVDSFSPHAAYYEALDCIEYVNKDCTVIAERIDEVLTLLRKNGTQEYVGFKIKGFRNYFEKNLKQMYRHLNEKDFMTLTNVMEPIFQERAPELMSSKKHTAKSAYRIVYEMIDNNAIELFDFDLAKVA